MSANHRSATEISNACTANLKMGRHDGSAAERTRPRQWATASTLRARSLQKNKNKKKKKKKKKWTNALNCNPRLDGHRSTFQHRQSMVAQKLREAIMSGTLKPGQRLVERELCEMTGVSRPSIREALRLLEADGLVTTVPHRGPVVSTISLDEARQLFTRHVPCSKDLPAVNAPVCATPLSCEGSGTLSPG